MIKNEQELQQLEQGLGDIFGDDEGISTHTNTPITPLSTTIPVPTQVSTSASETLSAPETSSVESAPVV